MTAELRVDPLTGTPVYVTTERQTRPNRPDQSCPFCPGGLEAPEPYDVRWFVNRWPAMPDDRCEVLLYSPRHDAAFWELGVEGAARVVALWSERTAALGARPDVAYVLPFENRGADVGATIPHPHGQLYAFDQVPPAVRDELRTDDCALCAPDLDDGLLVHDGAVRAWTPAASSWPYELLLAPKAHVPDLPNAPGLHHDIAAALVDVLHRLDLLFAAPMPYMLWVHQAPSDGSSWPAAHMHIHIAPFLRSPGVGRFVAAGELGSGVYFNPVDPVDAARRLREVGA